MFFYLISVYFAKQYALILKYICLRLVLMSIKSIDVINVNKSEIGGGKNVFPEYLFC